MSSYFFVLRHLVLLWLVCFVIDSECAAHQKRDVHHMIVLKDNSKRNRNKHGNHVRSSGRHKRKKAHYRHKYREDDFEDSEERGQRGRDNGSYESVEDGFYSKKLKRNPRKHKSHRHKEPRGPPVYVTNQDGDIDQYDEVQYESQWTPLKSVPTQPTRHQTIPKKKKHLQTQHKSKIKKYQKKRSNKLQKVNTGFSSPFFVEITTEKPLEDLQRGHGYRFENPGYASSFAQFDMNKVGRGPYKPQPLIGTIEQHKKADFTHDFFNRHLDNHREAQKNAEIMAEGSAFLEGDQQFSGSKLLIHEVDLSHERNEDEFDV